MAEILTARRKGLRQLVASVLIAVAVATLAAGCDTKVPSGPSGVTQTSSVTTTIVPSGPGVFVFSPGSPKIDQPVVFNAEGSTATAGRTIVSYEWNFGDGGHGAGLITSHTYTAESTYNVVLTVRDNAQQVIEVSRAVPVLGRLESTTTTSVPSFTTARYVNTQAPDGVPSDVSLVIELFGGANSVRFVTAASGQRAAGDAVYTVRGVYRTPDGKSGEIRGTMTGVIAPRVMGQFSGSLTTTVGTCRAERQFAGQLDLLLQWTAGAILDACVPTPWWTSASLVMSVSSGTLPTTTSTTSIPVTLGTLKGTVTSASTNAPIAGASITVFNSVGVSQGTLTASDGSYTLTGLAAGAWTVQVTHPSYTPRQDTVSIALGRETVHSPTLTTTTLVPGTLRGTVTSASTNGPIAGASITAFNSAGASQGTLTSSDGSYTLTGLAPGAWTVRVTHPSYNPRQDAVSISSGSETVHSPTLTATTVVPGTLRGTVTSASTNARIAGASVTVSNSAGASQVTRTNSDGTYAITGLAPGVWTVQVTHPSYMPVQDSISIISGSETVRSWVLTEPPGSLSGRVTTLLYQEKPVPIDRATVTLFNSAGASQGVLTNRDGYYSITGLAPGSWTVLVAHPWYISRQDTKVIASGPETFSTTLTPTTTSTLTGMVTSYDSEGVFPIYNALVTVSVPGAATSVQTDQSGRYSIAGIPPGTWTVTVSAAGYDDNQQDVVINPGAVTHSVVLYQRGAR